MFLSRCIILLTLWRGDLGCVGGKTGERTRTRRAFVASLFNSSMSLDYLFNLSVSEFLHMYNGNTNSPYLVGLLGNYLFIMMP